MLVKALIIQYLFYVVIRAPVMLIFEMEKYDSGYNLTLCYAQMHSYNNNNNDKILLDTLLLKVLSKTKINNKTETRSIRFAQRGACDIYDLRCDALSLDIAFAISRLIGNWHIYVAFTRRLFDTKQLPERSILSVQPIWAENDRCFADDIMNCNLLKRNLCILDQSSLKVHIIRRMNTDIMQSIKFRPHPYHTN